MDILDKIITRKIQQVDKDSQKTPVHVLEEKEFFSRSCLSLKAALLQEGSSGIIAEHKRRSPSKGVINKDLWVKDVTIGYAEAGAAALSVLTDNHFFGGRNTDIINIRKHINIPILRKDFTISEYQIIEAKAIGADVILLIAACLMPKQAMRLAKFAHNLGLEVLLEIHNQQEAEEYITDDFDCVGVNNRNLRDFSVDIGLSETLINYMPKDMVRISESGISEAATVKHLRKYGYNGFLMGENFMKTNNPAQSLEAFVKEVRS